MCNACNNCFSSQNCLFIFVGLCGYLLLWSTCSRSEVINWARFQKSDIFTQKWLKFKPKELFCRLILRVLTFSLHLSQCLHSNEPKPTCFDLCLSISTDSLIRFDNVSNDSSRKLSSGTLVGNKVKRPIRDPQALLFRFEVSNDQCIEANGTVYTIFSETFSLCGCQS